VQTELFSINSNVTHVACFGFAIGFAIIAIILNKVRKSANPLNGQTIFLDLLRGAIIFPLMLFSLSALMTQIGKFALTGDRY
jgi:hypothetical protein